MDHRFAGDIILKGSKNYEESRFIWNRSIDRYPLGIIYCTNTFDVCTAVNFVRRNNQRCRVSTGGHNSLGFCTDNDVYVINLSRINHCTYHSKFQMVYTGCATTCPSLCNAITETNCFFPGPDSFVCNGVWSLCGGIGCSCRRFGLGCDLLVEVELVDYRGEVIIANACTNRDLFWAIRGAGAGNFGIVTSLTYRIPPRVENFCYFEMRIYYCSRSSMISFLEIWQSWIRTLDVSVNCQAHFCNTFHEGRYIYAYGVSFHSVEETKVFLNPFTGIRGIQFTYESTTYAGFLGRMNHFYSPNERFTSVGRYVYDQYATTDLETIVDMVYGRRAEGGIFTSVTLTGMGGVVSSFGNQDTAFYYRDAKYLISMKSQWFEPSFQSSNDLWLQRKFDYLSSVTRGGYINQPYRGYQNYEAEYYGENMEWLREVKARYDPYNFFEFPQSIRI